MFLKSWSPSFGDIGDAVAITEQRGQGWPALHADRRSAIASQEQLARAVVDSVTLKFRTGFLNS